MASSQASPFDSSFFAFAGVYVLDGFLTMFAFAHGLAVERNPLAAGLPPHGFLSLKFLGLMVIMLAVAVAARWDPLTVRWAHVAWRAWGFIFSAVCVSNLSVLAREVGV